MDVQQFKKIVSCFAQVPSNIESSQGEFVVQLLDDLVVARLVRRSGALYVVEDEAELLAETWIIRRVARLPLLAERIRSALPPIKNFIDPHARALRTLDVDPAGNDVLVTSAIEACRDALSKEIPGTTNVVYLTSDAGEGKTTLINELARRASDGYLRNQQDWIVLPIPLGGRSFLRFDELVVGALMTQLRFQYWFYDGFVELVRMGAVVPAFDGFEEMIVEGASGDAVSALGHLMNQLDSEGTVLFAARKAFFEYQSFKTQARLFDVIGKEDSVSFSRIALERWSKTQFEEYGAMRGSSLKIYDLLETRLGKNHPLLTRAVLVKRLFDIVQDLDEAEALIGKLGDRPQHYFHQFVLAIIEREAAEKWPDKIGHGPAPLLSVEEHVSLLSAVAREMWLSSADGLRPDVLDVVADLFCDERKKSPAITKQVKERILHHALLVTSSAQRGMISFDHEDFRQFFIGVALGNTLCTRKREDIRSFLRVSAIAADTADEALLIYSLEGGERDELIELLTGLADGELPTSFVLENAGTLLLRLLDGGGAGHGVTVAGLVFGSGSLQSRSLADLVFRDCYFAPTAVGGVLHHVRFEGCRFERIEFGSQEGGVDSELDGCVISAVVTRNDDTLYDPASIRDYLRVEGFKFSDSTPELGEVVVDEDWSLLVTVKVIKAFLRHTQQNEDTLRMKLGSANASQFFERVAPELLRVRVLEQVQYRGSGNQNRFRLGKPMGSLQTAIAQSKGNFDSFLALIEKE